MPTQNNKRVSLLRHWMTRYLYTLIIGLVIIGIGSTYIIEKVDQQRKLDMMEIIADETASKIATAKFDLTNPIFPNGESGDHHDPNQFRQDFIYFLYNEKGQLLFGQPKGLQPLGKEALTKATSDDGILNIDRGNFLFAKSTIEINGETSGWLLLLQPQKEFGKDHVAFLPLISILIGLALAGGSTIYFLSKKLSTPIRNVAEAAKLIEEGHYDGVIFEENIKEEEIYHLVRSFKNMSERLQKLETMRSELLAGVTHELKTPVTSISGLVQAVRDDVVTGEEAKEFLDICFHESERLKVMVDDLVHLNNVSIGAIPVKIEQHNLNELVGQTVRQWSLSHDTSQIHLDTTLPTDTIFIETDSTRFYQIMTNCLNNAFHSLNESGEIEVSLTDTADQVCIDIKDTGCGIPKEEWNFIFERFYRGTNKKFKVRGLGIGLPLSRMMAKALGGDLFLKNSSEKGTTFTLVLPK